MSNSVVKIIHEKDYIQFANDGKFGDDCDYELLSEELFSNSIKKNYMKLNKHFRFYKRLENGKYEVEEYKNGELERKYKKIPVITTFYKVYGEHKLIKITESKKTGLKELAKQKFIKTINLLVIPKEWGRFKEHNLMDYIVFEDGLKRFEFIGITQTILERNIYQLYQDELAWIELNIDEFGFFEIFIDTKMVDNFRFRKKAEERYKLLKRENLTKDVRMYKRIYSYEDNLEVNIDLSYDIDLNDYIVSDL